jgi:ATP-dependent RNA helicase DHX8/PRP22
MALEQLQMLSLVQRVCQELETHAQINDKDLAEFIIDIADESDSLQIFCKKLAENGAEFADDFNANIFGLIRKMRPKRGSNSSASSSGLASSKLVRCSVG